MNNFLELLNSNGVAIQAILTGALVFITLLYVIFTYWLVKESRANMDATLLPVLVATGLQSNLVGDKECCTFRLKNIGHHPALSINIEFFDPALSTTENERGGRIGSGYVEYLLPNEKSHPIKFERNVKKNRLVVTKVDILCNDINHKNILTYFPIIMSTDAKSDPSLFVNSYKVRRIKSEYEFWKGRAIFFPSRQFLNDMLGGNKAEYKRLLKRYRKNQLKHAFPTFYYFFESLKHKDD